VLPEIFIAADADDDVLCVRLRNYSKTPCTVIIEANAYGYGPAVRIFMTKRSEKTQRFNLTRSGRWYDFTATISDQPDFLRRFAGRLENGRHSVSDPAMGRGGAGE
jgi:phospholipase C